MSESKSEKIDLNVYSKFTTLRVFSPESHVLQVEINRPTKRNAMNKAFWREMVDCFTIINKDKNVRVVIISGAGPIFTAGLDLSDHMDTFGTDNNNADIGRKGNAIREQLLAYQQSFTILNEIKQPVIAAVHSACVGGGVDLITACDIRICTSDAWFTIKEVDIGMVADVGTFPRLCKVIGNDSFVREISMTGRNVSSTEALTWGLVSHVYKDRETMYSEALKLAKQISNKSPIAIMGIKRMINYSRDHNTRDSLEYVAAWNMSMLQSVDTAESVTAQLSKRPPIYSNL